MSQTERRRAAAHRRQELVRAQEKAEKKERRHRRRRRIGFVLVIVLVVAGAAAGVWELTRPGPYKADTNLLGTIVPGAKGELGVTSSPATYTVTYQVDTYPGGQKKKSKPSITTEDVTVQRPFDGRVVEKQGPPPGGAVQLDVRSTLGLHGDYSDPTNVQVAQEEPTLSAGDLRVDDSLSVLVGGGFFKPRERRTFMGRQCQVYRTGSPIESLTVTAPTKSTYADGCIDSSGLLLEEISVSGNAVTSRVKATAIDDTSTVSPDNFTIEGTPQSVDAGGVALQPIDPTTAPTPGYYAYTATPDGWTADGRFLMTTVNSDTGDQQETYVDVYAKGADFLVIEQGDTSAQPPADLIPGSPADAGALGTSQIVPGLAGNTLTANPNPNWFVRMVGSVPADQLAQLARALHT